MSVEFGKSETKINLMRAFAGESQARNRYTFAASEAKSQKLFVVHAVFDFTAEQEKAHAKVFGDFLRTEESGSIRIDGGYPTDPKGNVAALLRAAQHNENEEFETVYKSFADTAEEEGFSQIAAAFRNIAKIEKVHSDRFSRLAELLEADKLFVSDIECDWMCLNCGYIFSGREVPEKCPVCSHDRGYFIRYTLAPYSCTVG